MKYYLTSILLLLLLVGLNSCHVARYVYWNTANIDDYKKFDNATIQSEDYEEVFSYKEKSFTLPKSYQTEDVQNLDTFLEQHKTVSFAIIVNDTVLKENYYNKYDKEDLVTSFSVAKSFVATLVGIAVDEGKIKNIDDPITNYLTYLDPEEFSMVTIRDLLNMRSGIDANEGYYNPFGEVAKYYYGINIKKYLTQVKRQKEYTEKFEYRSVNTQLLADIVEKATGQKIQDYLQEKIWQPLHMQSDGLWSIDSKKNQQVKAYCCINARTMDFARFGRLYLHDGVWNGKRILSHDWIEQTRRPLKDNIDWQKYPYAFQWRITKYGAMFAKGIKGQYIYIYPEKNLVAVRFGSSYADIDWADFFKQFTDENL